jgi:AcrR family transcriptional regulator
MALERLTPDKRRELTRTHLLEAAARVFQARGFAGASVDEIAAAAGFTKGAVYSNFKSKEDLFLALVDQRMRAQIQDFGDLAVQNRVKADDLIAAFSHVYRSLQANENEWVLWTEFSLYALRDPELRRQLVARGRAATGVVVEVVRQDCRELGINPPLPVEQLATMYIALFAGLGQLAAIDPEAVTEDLFGAAIVFVRDAMKALGRTTRTKRRRRPSQTR